MDLQISKGFENNLNFAHVGGHTKALSLRRFEPQVDGNVAITSSTGRVVERCKAVLDAQHLQECRHVMMKNGSSQEDFNSIDSIIQIDFLERSAIVPGFL